MAQYYGQTNSEVNPEKRPKKKKSYAGAIALMVTFMVIISGSVVLLFLPEKDNKKGVQATPTSSAVTQSTTPSVGATSSETGENGSTLLAIVLHVDTQIKTIKVYDVLSNEERTLIYTGSTTFLDDFDTQLVAAQLQAGDMLDLEILEEENRIVAANTSKKVWKKAKIMNPTVYSGENRLSFREQNYKYDDGLCIISNGNQISLEDIHPIDELTILGIDEKVYEIIVTKGHGEIELANEEDFIGGTISIGSGIEETIRENTSYVVKEGSYKVKVTCGEYTGTETIIVERDKTSVFDVFQYGRGPIQTGTVVFKIEPLGATLTIDGEKVSYYGQELELDYGVYSIVVSEGGYLSYESKLYVDRERIQLTIYLTESVPSTTPDEDDTTQGGNTTGEVGNETGDETDNAPSGTPTPTPIPTSVNISALQRYELNESNAIYILGPVGATIYLDGEELGTAPMDFEKIIGSFMITVVKENGDVKNINCTETNNGDDTYYNFDW